MNILILDAETTGLPPKNGKYDVDYNEFPRIVEIAWYFEGDFKHYILKSDIEIPQQVIDIHGITNEMSNNGHDPDVIFKELMDDCLKSDKIIGHGLYFDTSVIKSHYYRNNDDEYLFNVVNVALNKDKRIDTMLKSMKFVGAKTDKNRLKYPKLDEMYFRIFNDTFPAHSALEDVKAVLKCLPELIKNKVIEL